MHTNGYFYLGKISKKYGFKGEVVIKIDADHPEMYENITSFFVEEDKSLIPFFIENSSLKNEFLRVKLEDVSTEKEAVQLLNKKIFLPLDFLPKLDKGEFYYHEITDFLVFDDKKGYIGKIKSVNDSSAQPLFEIDFEGKEILIPMVDDIIKNVDKKNKKIELNVPDGLIDIYLK